MKGLNMIRLLMKRYVSAPVALLTLASSRSKHGAMIRLRMKRYSFAPVAVAFSALAIACNAHAVMLTAQPPSGKPNVAPPMKQEAAKSMADDSSGLRKGAVDAVTPEKGSFRIHGQELTYDPSKVRIFGRDGRPAKIQALKRGAPVRFTLDPSDPTHRRAAVIYLD